MDDTMHNMRQEIKHVCGDTFESVAAQTCLAPFSFSTQKFLNTLSRNILKLKEFRAHPEMMAFAYWIRGARLKTLQKEFPTETNTGILVARGTVFHVAPANVDTIFLYSLVLSMLMGNKNIVRISSKGSTQIEAVLSVMTNILDTNDCAEVKARLSVIRYERSVVITAHLSHLCDMRVLWGGNASVSAIRKLPLRPYATELCFPDKVAFAVFDAQSYLNFDAKGKASFAQKFYNDCYVFGQMACSSPHLIVWRGKDSVSWKAAEIFWCELEKYLEIHTPDLSDMDMMNKFVYEQSLSIRIPLELRSGRSNYLNVNKLTQIEHFDRENYCGGGFFSQVNIGHLDDIAPILGRNVQTVVSYGVDKEEWKQFILKNNATGIDRIVTPGEALSFAPVWDGFELLREFSREISIGV